MARSIKTVAPKKRDTAKKARASKTKAFFPPPPTPVDEAAKRLAKIREDSAKLRDGGRKAGRPSALTPELIQKFTDYIRAGNYAEVSARACGISERSYYRWMEEGERLASAGEDGDCRQFWQAVQDAEAEGEVQLVLELRKHAARTPGAVIEALARRFPKRWAKRDHVEVGGDLKVDTTDDLARKISLLAQSVSESEGSQPSKRA